MVIFKNPSAMQYQKVCFQRKCFRAFGAALFSAILFAPCPAIAQLGRAVRQELMATCRLHTILRLPKGIFPGAGVKTNVLFFAKQAGHATGDVWFYDLRSNMPTFGKCNALLDTHFEDFERFYGNDPAGMSLRNDEGEDGRWRKLSRTQIAERSDNLNWLWLRDESGDPDDTMQDPAEILVAIIGHLRAALGELNALNAEVEGDDFQVKLTQ